MGDRRLAGLHHLHRYRHPPSFVGATLVVPNLQQGKYSVEFWNTYSGKVTGTQEASTQGETLKISLPTVQADLAVKVRKVP